MLIFVETKIHLSSGYLIDMTFLNRSIQRKYVLKKQENFWTVVSEYNFIHNIIYFKYNLIYTNLMTKNT